MTSIEVRGLTKVFPGGHRALDDVTFTAPGGAVTGFVGRNGAGKTTTIRCLLGLVAPTSGQALVDGRRYEAVDRPRALVGTVLDVPGAHPGHTGRAHLDIISRGAGFAGGRVDEVLDRVELTEAAGRRVGGYSLGMRQRLSLAAALLGDPPVLILDEPTKGLDPPGIRWLRTLVRSLADEGRCVLMSSHHLDELGTLADRVVMIDAGRLLADAPTGELLARRGAAVVVSTPSPQALRRVVAAGGGVVDQRGDDLHVTGLSAPRIGEIAAGAGIAVHGLAPAQHELEALFFELSDQAGGHDVAAHQE